MPPSSSSPQVQQDSLTANAATLVYGDTQTGKSALLATLFLWVWRTFHKRSRYYSFDTGGYPDIMKALIKKGIVEVYRPRTRDPHGAAGLAIGTLAAVAKGAWPLTWDPLSGDAAPGCPLVPAVSSIWALACPNGHLVKSAHTQPELASTANSGAACPTCNSPLALTTPGVRITENLVPSPGFDAIGAIGFDGLTTMDEWCMDELDYRAGMGTLGGIKGELNTVVSDGAVYGSSGMGAIGFAQNRAVDWLRSAALIPNLVVPPHFTALTNRGSDQGGMPVYTPQIAGRKKGFTLPREVGNLLVTVVVPIGGRVEHRLCLRSFTLPGSDPTTYMAGVRSVAAYSNLPAYLADPEGATLKNGQLFSEFSLGKFWSLLQGCARDVEDMVAGLLGDDVPGLGSGSLPAGAEKLAASARAGIGEGVGQGQGQGGMVLPSGGMKSPRKMGAGTGTQAAKPAAQAPESAAAPVPVVIPEITPPTPLPAPLPDVPVLKAPATHQPTAGMPLIAAPTKAPAVNTGGARPIVPAKLKKPSSSTPQK